MTHVGGINCDGSKLFPLILFYRDKYLKSIKMQINNSNPVSFIWSFMEGNIEFIEMVSIRGSHYI